MSNNTLEEVVDLRAGPLAALFSHGDLRSVRLDGREIVNRVYFALRDHNWGTVPGVVSQLEIKKTGSGFLITFQSEHRQGGIGFVWNAVISGKSDGIIRYEFRGEALSDFFRNRIGFCVLHPMNAAGHRVLVGHPDGSSTEGTFPKLISPHQPFKEIAAIRDFLPAGQSVEVRFEGDIFEMEDQRNWTDATFKTYCTPLRLAFPIEVHRGEKFCQSVMISLLGEAGTSKSGFQVKTREHRAARVEERRTDGKIAVGPLTDKRLVPLGLAWNRAAEDPRGKRLEQFRALRLSHLYVELNFADRITEEDLYRASMWGRELDVPLQVAVRLQGEATAAFERLLAAVREGRRRIDSWTVLSEAQPTTSRDHLMWARELLSSADRHEPIGGGTRAFFAELNRNHPPVDLLDYVSYTVNPQVHASDELSIVETLGGQRATVESASAIAPGKGIYVGPVSLKMQWNPNATAAPPPLGTDELPPEVDVRQRLPFAAAWTLGSIKALSESGASRATFYEMVGWKGVVEREAGSLLPSAFPSKPGELYPTYHLLAALGEAAGGTIVSVASDDPLAFDGLAVRKGSLVRVFIANYRDARRRLGIEGISNPTRLSVLGTAGAARPATDRTSVRGNEVEIELGPHEVAWFDCGLGS